jgi:hypothetical protein
MQSRDKQQKGNTSSNIVSQPSIPSDQNQKSTNMPAPPTNCPMTTASGQTESKNETKDNKKKILVQDLLDSN